MALTSTSVSFVNLVSNEMDSAMACLTTGLTSLYTHSNYCLPLVLTCSSRWTSSADIHQDTYWQDNHGVCKAFHDH